MQLPMFMDPREIIELAWPADVGTFYDITDKAEAWDFVLEDKRADFEWVYDEGSWDEPVREPVHLWRRGRGQRSSHAANNKHTLFMLTDGHHRIAAAIDNFEPLIPVVWVEHERESSSLWGDEKYVFDGKGGWRERGWLDAALIHRSTRALKGS
jgi:hypothetical protein